MSEGIDESYQLEEIAGHQPPMTERFPLQTKEFSNGKIVYRDLMPQTPNTPEDIPIISMVGWAVNQKEIGHTMEGVVKGGEHVITLDFEGSGRRVKGEGGYSRELNRQAKLLAEFINTLPQKKVDLIGLSMATITILSMIKHRPDIRDRIGSVIFVSPMGLGGPDNIVDLIKRQNAENKRKEKQMSPEDKAHEAVAAAQANDFFKHNKERATYEGFGMAMADIYEDLNLLKELGIKTAIIQGEQDLVNSAKRLEGNMILQTGYMQGEDPGLWVERDDIKASDHDMTLVEKETVKEHFRRKEEYAKLIQEKGKMPPVDAVIWTQGGHEIYAKDSMKKIILRTLDYLRNPQSYRKELNKIDIKKPILRDLKMKSQRSQSQGNLGEGSED